MSFVSFEFLILFLISVFLLIFLKNKTARKIAIIIINITFISVGTNWISVTLLCSLIFYFYVSSFLIDKFNKKWLFIILIITSIIPLFIFKYLSNYLSLFNSSKEKNCSFLSAAIIHVDTCRTEPSAFGLSFGARTLAGIMAVP